MDDKKHRLILRQAHSQAALETRKFEKNLMDEYLPQKELRHQIVCRPEDRVKQVTFMPDGQTLMAICGRSIFVYDILSGKIIRVLGEYKDSIGSFSLNTDGKTFVITNFDDSIRVCDCHTGNEIVSKSKQYAHFTVLALPDGKSFLHSGYKSVHLYDTATVKDLKTIRTRFQTFVTSLAVSPDGKTLAVGDGTAHSIELYDLTTGECLLDFSSLSGAIFSLAFSPDGKKLVSGGDKGIICVWNVRKGKLLHSLSGHAGKIWDLAVTADGQTLISAGEDKTLRSWDIKRGRLKEIFVGHSKDVRSVSISPTGKTIASGSLDATVRLWDLESGRSLKMYSPHTHQIKSLQLLANGYISASVKHWDKNVYINSFDQKNFSHRRVMIPSQILSLSISPDGKMAAAGDKRVIHLYETRSGRLQGILSGHEDYVRALAFSPDGEYLLSGAASRDKSIRIWEVKSGKCLQVMENQHAGAYTFTFMPDGKTFLLGGMGTISLWNFNKVEYIRQLVSWSERKLITSFDALAVHPAGKIIVSGSRDQMLRFWDFDTGESLRLVEDTSRLISGLAVSPDGRLLVSANAEGRVNYRDFESGQLLGSVYDLEQGYLWATPPDEFTQKGWVFTNHPDLISIQALDKKNGAAPEVLLEKSEPFVNYLQELQDEKMVFAKIFDPQRYRELASQRAFSRLKAGAAFLPDRPGSAGYLPSGNK